MNFSMIKSTFLSILIILILIGCEKSSNCIEGNSISETQELREYGFEYIRVIGDYFSVFIHIGEPAKNIILEGESNILPVLFTDVSLNDLYIQELEDICIEPNTAIKVNIYNPQLTGIGSYGKSNIETDSIFSEYFRIFSMGNGLISVNITTDSLTIGTYHNARIDVEGRAKKAYVTCRDNSQINTYLLKQDSCFVSLIGSGEVYVNAERYLEVKIEGDGTVYYIGEPTVISEINGSGKIVHQ